MMRSLRRLFSSRPKGPRHVLLHCHVFKNAGSTIDGALQRTYGRAFFDHREDKVMRKQGMEYLVEFLTARPSIRAISSHHMPFSLDFPSDNFVFHRIVMLRDPIDRAGSVHAFEAKQRSGTAGARRASELDAPEYFEWRLGSESPAVVRNFQSRYLSEQKKPKLSLSDEMLRKACDALSHPDVSFGIVERFDESMVVIEDRLREIFSDIDLAHVVRNRNREGDIKSRHEELRELIGADLYHRLNEANAGDIELHRQANDKLNRLIDAIPDFELKLADYRKRCAEL